MDSLTHGTLSALRHTVLDDLVEEVGEWVPIHCMASGKLCLAFMTSTKHNSLLRNIELHRLTEKTVTDLAVLRAMLVTINSNGYSEDQEEFITGLVAIAVPVFNTNNELRAAVAMHAPTSRVNSSDALKMLPALRKAAERTTALL